jgi:enoyl-CoA hydratase/carnithine racemase
MKIGLCCMTPMGLLTRAIGRKRALKMLLTRKVVSAERTADWRLVNRVMPADQLDATVHDLALPICNISPLSIELGKQAFYVRADLDDPNAHAYAKELMTMNAVAPTRTKIVAPSWRSASPSGRGTEVLPGSDTKR